MLSVLAISGITYCAFSQVASAPSTKPAKVLPTLTIGDKAPVLTVAKWFKGTPVDQFQPGNIYVVECWATWCGPCKEAMPHLTALAKKYSGKVTFIGVDVFEHPYAEDKVAEFVKNEGDDMGYNVAAEGGDSPMQANWLKPAKQNAIPCTFVIGKDGNVAWIGHPMELEPVLQATIAGTFDVKSAADAMAKKQQAKADEAAMMNGVKAAIKTKDPSTIVAAIDELVGKHPEMELRFAEIKFDALLKIDESKAFTYLRESVTNDRWIKPMQMTSTSVVGRIAERILSPNSKILHPDYDIVLEMMKRTDEATGGEYPGVLATYAKALFRTGHHDQAIELVNKAIGISQATADKAKDANRKTFELAYVEKYKVELAEFQQNVNPVAATQPIGK
jgi:thiol-disulfide isomerase/thioredoxin